MLSVRRMARQKSTMNSRKEVIRMLSQLYSIQHAACSSRCIKLVPAMPPLGTCSLRGGAGVAGEDAAHSRDENGLLAAEPGAVNEGAPTTAAGINSGLLLAAAAAPELLLAERTAF